jgi:hypothetical protein
MKRLYLLGSVAIIGLTVLGGVPTFGHGGGHGHGGHSHHTAAHHAAPHHSAPSHAAHAHVAGRHSAANHSFVHNGHSWHHHGWSNGYWGNFGDGYVAPGITVPWYYDQFSSTGPDTVVVPGGGAMVTSEYMNNVIRPAVPPAGPTGPVEFSPDETCNAP